MKSKEYFYNSQTDKYFYSTGTQIKNLCYLNFIRKFNTFVFRFIDTISFPVVSYKKFKDFCLENKFNTFYVDLQKALDEKLVISFDKEYIIFNEHIYRHFYKKHLKYGNNSEYKRPCQ